MLVQTESSASVSTLPVWMSRGARMYERSSDYEHLIELIRGKRPVPSTPLAGISKSRRFVVNPYRLPHLHNCVVVNQMQVRIWKVKTNTGIKRSQ